MCVSQSVTLSSGLCRERTPLQGNISIEICGPKLNLIIELSLDDHPLPGNEIPVRVRSRGPTKQYFLTLMTYDLPFDLLLRVWDIFFSEGMKTVFRVGVALFQREEDALMTLTFEHLVGRIKQMPTDIISSPTTPDEESQNVHNIDVLIRDAMSVKMSDLLRESATQYLSSH